MPCGFPDPVALRLHGFQARVLVLTMPAMVTYRPNSSELKPHANSDLEQWTGTHSRWKPDLQSSAITKIYLQVTLHQQRGGAALR